VQCDEDVERSVDLLLSRPIPVKKAAKAGKNSKAPAQSGSSTTDARGSAGQDTSSARPSRKDADSSGKLEHLVQQVLTILPQSEEDTIRQALVDSREDLGKSVDLLMTKMFNSNMSVKVREAASDQDGIFDISEREARPKTTGEKEAQKLGKKMREIERIEERVRNKEKVDPLQLPKLDKKGELQAQLTKAEEVARAEAVKADAEERQQIKAEQDAAMKAARAAVADLKAKSKANSRSRESHKAVSAVPPAPSAPPVQPEELASTQAMSEGGDPTKKEAGMKILNMLHGSRQQAQSYAGYEQSANLATELGGRNAHQGDDMWKLSEGGTGKAPRWSDESWESQDKSWDHMNEYSTPLPAVSKEQRLHAERIAKEIEEESKDGGGYEYKGRSKGGGGKGYKSDRRDDGKGKGKRDGKDDRDGKGRREYKGDREGKGYREGKGDRDYEGKGDREGKSDRKGKGKDRGGDFDEGKGGDRDGGDRDGDFNAQRRARESRPQQSPTTTMNPSRLNW